MTFRLRASGGVETPILKSYLNQMSLFVRYPHLADSGSYQLRCKVSQNVLNVFVDKVYDDSTRVEVTKENFEQLRSLCEELGFSRLDQTLREFTPVLRFDDVVRQNQAVLDAHQMELEQLKRQIAEYGQVLANVQRELARLADERLVERVEVLEANSENTARAFRDYVESKVNEVERGFEMRNVEVLQKVGQVFGKCAKQSDLEKLALDVAELKRNEKGTARKSSRKPQAKLTTVVEPAPPTPRLTHGIVNSIISELSRKCGGNVHDTGMVNVTASSVYSISHYPKNAVDLETNAYYLSMNERDSWICYDFKSRRVIPVSYSVRSYRRCPGSFHPKSWVIEVSDDGTEGSWQQLDRRDDNDDLNGHQVTGRFHIRTVPTEPFRFFRLRQTGENHHGNYYLALCSLDISGFLFE